MIDKFHIFVNGDVNPITSTDDLNAAIEACLELDDWPYITYNDDDIPYFPYEECIQAPLWVDGFLNE